MTAGTELGTATDPDVDALDPAELLSRRNMFAVGGAGALALGLAACGGSSSSDASAKSTPAAPAPTSPAAATPAAPATSAASSGAGTGGTALTKLSKVPVGGSIGLSVNGKPIIVSQPTAGNVVAFSAICPHAGCTVAPAGSKPLLCPCHGSTFDAATGKNLSGPAQGRPLTPLNVEVSGTEVKLKA